MEIRQRRLSASGRMAGLAWGLVPRQVFVGLATVTVRMRVRMRTRMRTKMRMRMICWGVQRPLCRALPRVLAAVAPWQMRMGTRPQRVRLVLVARQVQKEGRGLRWTRGALSKTMQGMVAQTMSPHHRRSEGPAGGQVLAGRKTE